MAMREYVGARYVPIFADPTQWDITLKYEPLTVVTDNGASYVSRRYVPEGIQLTNTDYWILWADYNAQLQQLIEDVNTYNGRIEDLEEALPVTSFDDVNTVEAAISALDTRTDAIEDALPIADFDDVNTVSAGISALDSRIDALEDALPIADFDDVNTVDARFDIAEGNIATLQSDMLTKVNVAGTELSEGRIGSYFSGSDHYLTIGWVIDSETRYQLQIKTTAPRKAELYYFYSGGYSLLMTFTTT